MLIWTAPICTVVLVIRITNDIIVAGPVSAGHLDTVFEVSDIRSIRMRLSSNFELESPRDVMRFVHGDQVLTFGSERIGLLYAKFS